MIATQNISASLYSILTYEIKIPTPHPPRLLNFQELSRNLVYKIVQKQTNSSNIKQKFWLWVRTFFLQTPIRKSCIYIALPWDLGRFTMSSSSVRVLKNDGKDKCRFAQLHFWEYLRFQKIFFEKYTPSLWRHFHIIFFERFLLFPHLF